ncbi:MAG: transcriptional regulator, TetR family protein [Frankiales bacterium]|nr:transcriptional regulator, TetR family protein [Frankiales bacterium]
MSAGPIPTGKPLRRDAAVNRERLLSAAVAVFNEQGLEAGVEDVARAAGVGMGTLYRRFPSKQALIDELIGGVRRDVLRLARAGQSAASHSDGAGLERLLVQTGELLAAQPACIKAFSTKSESGFDEVLLIRAILADLLADAQRHGRIRAEVVPSDITVLLWSLTAIIETTQSQAPQAWRRHLELLIAGLRPATPPLIGKPLTEAELRAVSGNPRGQLTND